MTISRGIRSLDLDLPRDLVVRFLDYPEGRQPPERIEHLLGEVLEEARPLVRARGVLRPLAVERAAEVGLADPGAEGLVIGLVTAGPDLEARVTEHTRRGAITRALLLDATGSAAAEEAADALTARLARTEGPAPSCRISPGYGAWPLEAQPAIFQRLPAAELGVRLEPSLLMVPRKSISFASWLGAGPRPRGTGFGCASCPLPHCRYRRAPARAAGSTPPAPNAREDES